MLTLKGKVISLHTESDGQSANVHFQEAVWMFRDLRLMNSLGLSIGQEVEVLIVPQPTAIERANEALTPQPPNDERDFEAPFIP